MLCTYQTLEIGSKLAKSELILSTTDIRFQQLASPYTVNFYTSNTFDIDVLKNYVFNGASSISLC
jgi:hypothetical protein